MDKPLDELYLEWLYSQVGSVEEQNPSRNYWRLLRQLYMKEFVWIVPRDDNRAADAQDLRYEFANEKQILFEDSGWFGLGVSMLEVMIALSRRLSFQAEGEPRVWFWQLMENLDLERYNDNTRYSERRVNSILDDVIFRTYRSNGRGGLFPLRRATEDQRESELWNQLSAYLLEAS
jgi:hypothetical protein